MTALIGRAVVLNRPRMRLADVWRIVRLHAVTPSVFFGIPWIIIAGAWLVMVVIGVVVGGAGVDSEMMREGMRYSWAILSPQWYLMAVGVQAVAMTLPFALGFGATRRDFWLGTSLMFAIVSLLNAIAIATLVVLEKETNGWWISISMFDTLWYGQDGWLADFYTTLALQLFVLFTGATVATVYLRWQIRGMLVLAAGTTAALLAFIAVTTSIGRWPELFEWASAIGVLGVFTVVLGFATVFAIGGYLVIRRATPR